MTKYPVLQRQGNRLVNLGNLGGGSTEYSTTETEVGEWINGKPIYRRVFSLGTIEDASATLGVSNTIYSTTNTISNVDNVINGLLVGTDNDTNAPYAIPIYVMVKNTYVYFATFMSINTVDTSNKIVVEYTKTTDTATI